MTAGRCWNPGWTASREDTVHRAATLYLRGFLINNTGIRMDQLENIDFVEGAQQIELKEQLRLPD